MCEWRGPEGEPEQPTLPAPDQLDPRYAPEQLMVWPRRQRPLEWDGLVVVLDGESSRFVGFIGDDTIELDAASREQARPFEGAPAAEPLQAGCADL